MMFKLSTAVYLLAFLYTCPAFSSDSPSTPLAVSKSIKQVHWVDIVGSCSGQFTSSAGHFLTAFHCADSMAGADVLTTEMDDGNGALIKMVSAHLHLPYPVLFQKTENMAFSGHLNRDSVFTQSELVALGAGYLKQYPVQKSTEQKITQYQEDFAVLKYSNPDISCVSIRKTTFIPGTQVWSAGFPFQYGLALESEHASLNIVSATAFNTFDELRKFRGTTQNFPEESWLAENRYLILTEPIPAGMSGGGVFDINGELVGINVGTSPSGFGIVLSIKFIQSILGPKASEIFSCNKK